MPFRTVNEPTAHRKWREKKASEGQPVCVPRSFEIHGLRTCQKCCRKTLNRDVNAAANMALVGVCQASGTQHPFRCDAPTRRARGTQEELYSRDLPTKPLAVEGLSDSSGWSSSF